MVGRWMAGIAQAPHHPEQRRVVAALTRAAATDPVERSPTSRCPQSLLQTRGLSPHR